MMKYKIYIATGVVILFAIIAIIAIFGYNPNSVVASNNAVIANNTSVIQVVAAENFWGSLVSQIGGSRVQVLSIVSDPNADPHEYESNAVDARAIANADFIIVNGAGYDDWANLLISAGTQPNCKVLNVAGLVGVKEGDNPHLWYDPDYVNETIKQMELDLISIDPSHASYYEQNYANLELSLEPYQNRIAEIKQQFNGTKVASTESIFQYMANATGLDLVSPIPFMYAVAEGNDPPVQSVAEFENQLASGNVSVLVYNEQTVTPLTQQMKQIAAQYNITTVGVTETMQPPDASFQSWMNAELINLQNALNANTLGK